MRTRISLIALAASVVLSGRLSAGVILTDNLTATIFGTDHIVPAHWEAISFLTDNNTYSLDTVTLLMSQAVVTDTPEVDLYSDASGPNSVLAILTGPGSFSTTLTNEDFTAAGVTLLPNTTYWVVLKALSGSFGWGYSGLDSGSGVGFTDTWAYMDNAPSGSWVVQGVGNQPDQAEVIGDLVSTPEPSTLWLIAPGCLLLAALRRRLA